MIVACKRRDEDKVLYKYNAIVLPQLYQTELLFRSHDQMGHQGIDKVYQRILKLFEWPGIKKGMREVGSSMSVMPTGQGYKQITISLAIDRVG